MSCNTGVLLKIIFSASRASTRLDASPTFDRSRVLTTTFPNIQKTTWDMGLPVAMDSIPEDGQSSVLKDSQTAAE